MRQQISISVPEDLHERLEKYREVINLSEICREALTAKLDEIESRRKDKKTVTVIERLKKQKKELENESLQAGKRALDSLLENLSYSELKQLLKVKYEPDSSNPYLTDDDVLEEFLKITDTAWEDWESDFEGYDQGSFLVGIFERLHERWETELKDQLEE